jgi:hypothetical protein
VFVNGSNSCKERETFLLEYRNKGVSSVKNKITFQNEDKFQNRTGHEGPEGK